MHIESIEVPAEPPQSFESKIRAAIYQACVYSQPVALTLEDRTVYLVAPWMMPESFQPTDATETR